MAAGDLHLMGHRPREHAGAPSATLALTAQIGQITVDSKSLNMDMGGLGCCSFFLLFLDEGTVIFQLSGFYCTLNERTDSQH